MAGIDRWLHYIIYIYIYIYKLYPAFAGYMGNILSVRC